jgi:catalase
MVKRNFILVICGIVALSAGIFYSTKHSKRRPSSIAEDNPNIITLRSIPLVKNLENPSSSEPDWTAEMIDMFDSFAERNRNQNGTLNRGTHAKGKCFRGNLEIFPAEVLQAKYGASPELAARLKRGLWKFDGQWPAVIRFANANGMGKIQADKEPDVRGFSFSVSGPPGLDTFVKGGRQDFMMNSTPQFASGEIHEFMEVVKAANTLIYKDFSHLPNPLFLIPVGRDLKLIDGGNRDGSNLKSYAHMEYWSNLPYTHGLNQNGEALDVVKYKATPCDGRGKQTLQNTDGLGDNYLQDEIVNEARNGEICMLIQAQFMDMAALRKTAFADQLAWTASDWVENGGLLWNEADMPFYTLARVTVSRAQGQNDSAELACEDQYINTRLHSGPQNQPVGSIARVRTFIEENSRARRMGK